MKKPAVLTIRAVAAALALGLFLVGLSGCSASDPLPGQSGPSLVPAPTSTPRSEDNVPGSTPAPPTATALPVASDQASTDGGPSKPVPTQPLSATETGAPATDAITAEQMVVAFENVLYGIYEDTLSSVVYIRVADPAGIALQGTPGVPDDLIWSAGSGFVWDAEGHIVTNHHVVEGVIGETDEVTVIFSDSTQVDGTIVGSDPHSDLAVIKLEDSDLDLHPVTLGDSSEVKVGQLTVAIGAPFGQEFTMTSGIVSAVGRDIRGEAQFTIPEVIQTDSAINPGNSGGPLLDSQGRVIGINTQIISRTGNFSGVGMAVPVNIARRVVPHLIKDGEFDYPWLGVNIVSLNSAYAEELDLPATTRGALIVAVLQGSPAYRAGLKGSEGSVEVSGVDYAAGGDIVVAVGGQEIVGSSELISHLTYHHRPGDIATFAILRDGDRRELDVTLGQRP